MRAAALLCALGLLTGNCSAAAQNPVPDTPAAMAPEPVAAELPPLQPCPVPANAAGTAPPAPMPAGLGEIIRERVRHRIGGTVTSVCRMPFGLYEVLIDSELLYVDERVNYLLAGNAFDLRTKENLTEARKENVNRVDFNTLPLQNAVKTVRGNGARVLAVFEDPNCPYCKRFEKDIATLDNITIYTFLDPILSRDQNAHPRPPRPPRTPTTSPLTRNAWPRPLASCHLPRRSEGCSAVSSRAASRGTSRGWARGWAPAPAPGAAARTRRMRRRRRSGRR